MYASGEDMFWNHLARPHDSTSGRIKEVFELGRNKIKEAYMDAAYEKGAQTRLSKLVRAGMSKL